MNTPANNNIIQNKSILAPHHATHIFTTSFPASRFLVVAALRSDANQSAHNCTQTTIIKESPFVHPKPNQCVPPALDRNRPCGHCNQHVHAAPAQPSRSVARFLRHIPGHL